MKILQIIKIEKNKAYQDKNARPNYVACEKIIKNLINYLKTGNISSLNEFKRQKETLINIVILCIESSDKLKGKYGAKAEKFTKEVDKINNVTNLVNLLMTVFSDIADDERAYTTSNIKKAVNSASSEFDTESSSGESGSEGKITANPTEQQAPAQKINSGRGLNPELVSLLRKKKSEEQEEQEEQDTAVISDESESDSEFDDDGMEIDEQAAEEYRIKNYKNILNEAKSFDDLKKTLNTFKMGKDSMNQLIEISKRRNDTIDDIKKNINYLRINLTDYYSMMRNVDKMPEGINIGTIINYCKNLRNISVNEYIEIYQKINFKKGCTKDKVEETIKNLEKNAKSLNISLKTYCDDVLTVLKSQKLSLDELRKKSASLKLSVHDYCLILSELKNFQPPLSINDAIENAKKLGITLNKYCFKTKTSKLSLHERLCKLELGDEKINSLDKKIDTIIKDANNLGYTTLDYINTLEEMESPPSWNKKNIIKKAIQYGFKDYVRAFSIFNNELSLNGFKSIESLLEKFPKYQEEKYKKECEKKYKEKYKEKYGIEFVGKVPEEELPALPALPALPEGKGIIEFAKEYIEAQGKRYNPFPDDNLIALNFLGEYDNPADPDKAAVKDE